MKSSIELANHLGKPHHQLLMGMRKKIASGHIPISKISIEQTQTAKKKKISTKQIWFDPSLWEFLCGTFSTKRRHDSVWVYAIQFANGIKIGRCKNMLGRYHNYSSPWCHDILDMKQWKTERANHIEDIIKRKFYSDTRPGSLEFIYGVQFSEVVSFIESQVTKG